MLKTEAQVSLRTLSLLRGWHAGVVDMNQSPPVRHFLGRLSFASVGAAGEPSFLNAPIGAANQRTRVCALTTNLGRSLHCRDTTVRCLEHPRR